MKNIKSLGGLLLAGSLIFSSIGNAVACTAVNIVAKDGSVVAGRTMEWAFDMRWQLTVNPKGTPISLSAPASLKLPATSLSSKYAFVELHLESWQDLLHI